MGLPPRLVLALSASAGAVFYGLYSFAEALRTRSPIDRGHLWRLLANVLLSAVAGVLVAAFLGPAIAAARLLPFRRSWCLRPPNTPPRGPIAARFGQPVMGYAETGLVGRPPPQHAA